jgi:ABC-type multidrug transport system ATPase subunit
MSTESPAIARAYFAIVSGLPARLFEMRRCGSFIAGRAENADFPLNHLEVSRKHCLISWNGKKCEIEDLGSVRGTKVNNSAVKTRVVLQEGDRVALGPVILAFGTGEPPSASDMEARFEATRTQGGGTPVFCGGNPVTRIALSDHLTFGREEGASVLLGSPTVSRRHAIVRRVATGYRVLDLHSSTGTFINGRRFDEHDLNIGDQLQIGPFIFQFDGTHLNRITNTAGSAIRARHLFKRGQSAVMLNDISLDVAASRFAGIIGASGAGKTSLLDALSGMGPQDEGTVEVDGVDIYASPEGRAFGYVPQEDIVHLDLRVADALTYSARMRLPRGTPRNEIRKLVVQTMQQLGLESRATAIIRRLSGGERKRVSVGVELLARPRILFLDEPTSGLDPATEFKLMELLRELADTGCTIVCTTHVMENVYLMDQVSVLCRGCIAFQGTLQEARDYFAVQRLSSLYDRLEEKSAEEWQEAFRKKFPELDKAGPAADEQAAPRPETERAPRRRAAAMLPLLLQRQLAILRADSRNLVILLAQPALIAALLSWVSDDTSLLLFFAYLATLWFGCSNAAQEIVKEIPIYRRERVVGLARHTYLSAKFVFLTTITAMQSLILYGCLKLGESGLGGSPPWQLAGLLGIAASSVGIGLAISSLARSVMQAVIVVPLVLIPQILLSGYPVPTHEMRPAVALAAETMPTFASQQMMDISFLWNKPLAREVLSDHWVSFRNMNRDGTLRTNELYLRKRPGARALITHLLWSVGAYCAAFFSLKAREKG